MRLKDLIAEANADRGLEENAQSASRSRASVAVTEQVTPDAG